MPQGPSDRVTKLIIGSTHLRNSITDMLIYLGNTRKMLADFHF